MICKYLQGLFLPSGTGELLQSTPFVLMFNQSQQTFRNRPNLRQYSIDSKGPLTAMLRSEAKSTTQIHPSSFCTSELKYVRN